MPAFLELRHQIASECLSGYPAVAAADVCSHALKQICSRACPLQSPNQLGVAVLSSSAADISYVIDLKRYVLVVYLMWCFVM